MDWASGHHPEDPPPDIYPTHRHVCTHSPATPRVTVQHKAQMVANLLQNKGSTFSKMLAQTESFTLKANSRHFCFSTLFFSFWASDSQKRPKSAHRRLVESQPEVVSRPIWWQLLINGRNLYLGLCVVLIVATRALQQVKKTTALMNSALGPGSRVDISWLNKQITEAERAPSFERPLFGANRESGNEMSIEQPSVHIYSVKALLEPKV